MFLKSFTFRQVSDLSKISTGKYFFLYTNFIGYLKDGPSLKFTSSFFRVKNSKLLFEKLFDSKKKLKKTILKNYFFSLQRQSDLLFNFTFLNDNLRPSIIKIYPHSV